MPEEAMVCLSIGHSINLHFFLVRVGMVKRHSTDLSTVDWKESQASFPPKHLERTQSAQWSLLSLRILMAFLLLPSGAS